MADVQFFGIGADGFPDPNVQILQGNRPSQAETQFFGQSSGPPPALLQDVELFSPSLTARPEFTQVEFLSDPPPIPASTNPNDNDILLIVTGGPTSGAIAINVALIPAMVPQGDGSIVQPPPVDRDLRLFAGPLSPSGIAGKIVTFIQPTGASTPAAIRGVTGTIAQVAGEPTGPVASPTGIALIFESALSVQPTNGDRLFITSDDRSLRRTPVIEIILE